MCVESVLVNTTSTITQHNGELYKKRLYQEYGYSSKQVKIEVPVSLGQSRFKADMIVFRENQPYILIELKEKMPDNISQIQEQIAFMISSIHCKYAVLTDGMDDRCFRMIETGAGDKIEQIPDIPRSNEEFGLSEETRNASRENLRKAVDTHSLLSSMLLKIYHLTRETRISPLALLIDFLKIIVAKIYDEKDTNHKLFFRADIAEDPKMIRTRIENLLSRANRDAGNIFYDTHIGIDEHILVDIVYKMQKYSLIESKIEDEAFRLLPFYLSSKNTSQYYTPADLAEFMIQLANPKKGENFLDLACGYGGLLILAGKNRARVFGFEVNHEIVEVAKAKLYISGIDNYHIYEQDSLNSLESVSKESNDQVTENMFDVIAVHPPFGMKLYDDALSHYTAGRTGSRSQYAEALFIEQSWRYLKIRGRLVIIVPDSLLTTESMLTIRKLISKWFKIKGIVSLSSSVFLPFTRLKTSILILEKLDNKYHDTGESSYQFFAAVASPAVHDPSNRTPKNYDNIVNAFKRYQAKEDLRDEYDSFVARLSEDFRFDVGFYVNQRKIGKTLVKTERLSTIAQINPGLRIGRMDPNGPKYYFIRAQNIFDHRVNLKNLDGKDAELVTCNELSANKFRVQNDDILLTKVGTVGNTGICEMNLEDPSPQVIFSDNIVRIRIHDSRILPMYLLAYLSSELGKAQIEQQTTGMTIKGISLTGISNIEIPLLPLPLQHTIAKDFVISLKMKEKIRELTDEYKHTQAAVSQRIKSTISNGGQLV